MRNSTVFILVRGTEEPTEYRPVRGTCGIKADLRIYKFQNIIKNYSDSAYHSVHIYRQA
jgi:hypothetical protein